MNNKKITITTGLEITSGCTTPCPYGSGKWGNNTWVGSVSCSDCDYNIETYGQEYVICNYQSKHPLSTKVKKAIIEYRMYELVKDGCPKCKTDNIHFNYDYTKKELPIEKIYCNECDWFVIFDEEIDFI